MENGMLLIGQRAKQAAPDLMALSTGEKNQILSAIAKALISRKEDILKANELDLKTLRQTVFPK